MKSIVIFGIALSIVSLTTFFTDYLKQAEPYITSAQETIDLIGDYLALTLAVVLIFIGVIAYRAGGFIRAKAKKKVGAPHFLFGAFFFALTEAAPPAGHGQLHPLRRNADGDQPQPRLRHHEARFPGAL